MKPYLFAPIVIAGLLTAAGSASIATAELNLFKSGREFVAMGLRKDSKAEQDIQWNSTFSGGLLAADLNSEVNEDLANLNEVDQLPAPEATVEVDEMGCEKSELECEKARIECEKAKADRDKAKTIVAKQRAASRKVRLAIAPKAPVTPEAPKGMLASSYAFRAVPTPGEAADFSMVVGTDKGSQVMTFSGVPDKPAFRMMFDSKKFAENHKMFAADMKKLHITEWKALSEAEIKKLKEYGIDVKVKGWDKDQVPTSITVDPMKVAGVAEVSFAALNDADHDVDEEDIATPNK